MKNTLLTQAMTVFMANIMYSAKKKKNKQDKDDKDRGNEVEVKQELFENLKNSIQQFKKEAEEKISIHEKSIVEFKARILNEKSEDKVKYEKKIARLEQKISILKKMLNNYIEDGQSNWTFFKNDFNFAMEEFEKALKDFSFINFQLNI